MEVKELDLKIHLRAIVNGLKKGQFADNLAKSKPTDLADFQKKDSRQIDAKEAALAKRQLRAMLSKPANKGQVQTGPPTTTPQHQQNPSLYH
ncbi:hypothetical protein SESBI_05795 [Sesbania bispinosa]|nr:hypothetical protein SESBI_05795 [Sesbania bispinosa]